MRRKRWLAVACAAGVLALGAWGFWLEPDSLHLNEYDLPLQHWPAELSGLRVALISDLHAGSPWIDLPKVQRVVDLTNAAHPDLILLAGDYLGDYVLGGSDLAPETLTPALRQLSAPLGVYAVLGNHDVNFETRRIRGALTAAGIRMMDDRVQQLNTAAAPLWLVGIGEFGQPPSKWRPLLDRVPADAAVMVFTHQPKVLERMSPRVNLALAGHTHGGQINLPLLRGLLGDEIRRHLAGHFLEQTDFFVTRGIGTSYIGVRINAPPEIALLTLHPAE